jgi:hypothetical protein
MCIGRVIDATDGLLLQVGKWAPFTLMRQSVPSHVSNGDETEKKDNVALGVEGGGGGPMTSYDMTSDPTISLFQGSRLMGAKEGGGGGGGDGYIHTYTARVVGGLIDLLLPVGVDTWKVCT